MGWNSSTTTTSVKTNDLSARGQSYDDLFSQILISNLNEFGGYNIVPKKTTKYKDAGKASSLQDQINKIDQQIAAAGSGGGVGNATGGGLGGLGGMGSNGGMGGNTGIVGPNRGGGSDISFLQSQKQRLQNELDGMEKSEVTEFDFQKAEDPRVKAAIDRYGPDAPEVTRIREQVKIDEQEKVEGFANVERSYVQNLQKLARGDYSYTAEQEKQISAYIDPIRNTIHRTTQDLLDQYGNSDKALRSSLLDLGKEIDKTGFAIEDALKAAEVQYDKSGSTLFNTLKTVNDSSRAKAQFQFDLLSQQADQAAAQQSALLGLPPGSQAEKFASQKMKTDALKQIELDLNEREAQGAMSIQGSVEQGKQQISLSRVALAQSQGGKKEDLAKMGFGLTQLLTGKQEAAIGARGNADIALEQQKQNMLYGAAFGNLPQILAASQAGMGFNQDMKAAQFGMAQNLLNPVAQQLGVEQQRQFAETTTKQTKKKGFLDAFTDILGGAAGVAGAVMGIPGLGGGGGGGGGGSQALSSYGPMGPSNGAGAGLNLSTYVPQAVPMIGAGAGTGAGR